MKSCFFIGHREASSEILPALAEAVEKHIMDCIVHIYGRCKVFFYSHPVYILPLMRL